jgi:hypothetical protein
MNSNDSKKPLSTVRIGKDTFTILFPDLLRPLTEQERRELKDSIRKHGVRVPLIVDEHKGIIDGANRATIVAELLPFEVSYSYRVEKFLTEERLASREGLEC